MMCVLNILVNINHVTSHTNFFVNQIYIRFIFCFNVCCCLYMTRACYMFKHSRIMVKIQCSFVQFIQINHSELIWSNNLLTPRNHCCILNTGMLECPILSLYLWILVVAINSEINTEFFFEYSFNMHFQVKPERHQPDRRPPHYVSRRKIRLFGFLLIILFTDCYP